MDPILPLARRLYESKESLELSLFKSKLLCLLLKLLESFKVLDSFRTIPPISLLLLLKPYAIDEEIDDFLDPNLDDFLNLRLLEAEPKILSSHERSRC
jgi:hypothetical protein